MSEKLTKFLTPVVALFFATALGVTAATTIGTDIETEGDITVEGTTTTAVLLGGADGEGVWAGFSAGNPTIKVADPYEEGYDFFIENSAGGDLTLENSGGGDVSIDATGGGSLLLSPSGGARVEISGLAGFSVKSSGGICDGDTRGTVAFANASNQLCFCDGSGWYLVASTTIACQFVGE